MTGVRAPKSNRLARLTAAAAESVVVRLLRWPVVRLPFLGRDLQSAPAGRADRAVVAVFDESRIMQAGFALMGTLERACRTSRSARIVSACVRRVVAIPVSERIRLSALALISAVMTHVAVTRFSAPEPTPIARAVWAGILIVLSVVVAAAGPLAAAWRDRSMRGAGNGGDGA